MSPKGQTPSSGRAQHLFLSHERGSPLAWPTHHRLPDEVVHASRQTTIAAANMSHELPPAFAENVMRWLMATRTSAAPQRLPSAARRVSGHLILRICGHIVITSLRRATPPEGLLWVVFSTFLFMPYLPRDSRDALGALFTHEAPSFDS